jgi:hypothetical protein
MAIQRNTLFTTTIRWKGEGFNNNKFPFFSSFNPSGEQLKQMVLEAHHYDLNIPAQKQMYEWLCESVDAGRCYTEVGYYFTEVDDPANPLLPKEPIPSGVYYSEANNNFHRQEDGHGMGTTFYSLWIDRAREFPGVSSRLYPTTPLREIDVDGEGPRGTFIAGAEFFADDED